VSTAELLAEGWELHRAGHYAQAERSYRRALQGSPQDASAWCYLGMACHDQGRYDEAVAAYQQALRWQPHFPIACNNLGNSLRFQGRLDEALAAYNQALGLKPDYVNALRNKGTALLWAGRLEEALACYRQGLQLTPDDPETHMNVGILLLLRGEFAEGWAEYEWRWKRPDNPLPRFPQPRWDGSPLDGRTILLTHEQGLGDTIHFVRYAARLKERFACRVLVSSPVGLQPLLSTCPGIDQLVTGDRDLPAFDVFHPLVSLPGLLRERVDTFPAKVPYLRADEARAARWRAELEKYPGARIGIAWRGNRKYAADAMRSIPLRDMLPLSKLEGIHWFSLQKGDGSEELATVRERWHVISFNGLDESGGSFLDTAAVLQGLDLVICADTAVIHLAGALGLPGWLALAHVPDWRWLLHREDSPWYPSLRLFRQPRPGDWRALFELMADELLHRFPGVRRKHWHEYQLATGRINHLVPARHGLMLYNPRDTYIGRSVERYGEYSQGEVELFRQVIRPGMTVVEVGANIGAHTLVLSQLVGEAGVVHAFEPQRILFQTLCANLALNSRLNVFCRCEAVADQPGTTRVPPLEYGQENNFGALCLGQYHEGEPVSVVTVDGLQLTRCDFLKADVEGMELEVLKGAAVTIRRCRPVLYVESDRPKKTPALIEHLLSLGYDLYWHLPPYFNPQNDYHTAENIFGPIVSTNILGIPASAKASIVGLRRITSPQDDWRSPPQPPRGTTAT
jgi:FkbM family methyltransferase